MRAAASEDPRAAPEPCGTAALGCGPPPVDGVSLRCGKPSTFGRTQPRAAVPHVGVLIAVVALLHSAGCKKDDMAEQPKVKAYEPAPLFADGMEARPIVAGTISRTPGRDTPGIPFSYQWAPGPVGASDAPRSDVIPFPITPELIDRGRQRFNIYCAVCHGRLGDGNGMIVQRGMIRPPSFHNDRLRDPRQTKDSHFFDVISNGYGAMFSYAERVAPADRWAITSYVRTLQASVRQAERDGRLSAEETKALKGTRP